MTRILARDGNVIQPDFRRRDVTPDVRVTTDILYADEAVALARFTLHFNGEPIACQHMMLETPTS